jgi:hypothetical protein
MEAVALWIPIISIVGSFGMVIAIVWLITRARQRSAQYRAEVQMKMLDRFGTGTEFAQFLQSPAGRQFMEQPRRNARERILWGIRSGIVLIFLGIAFFFGYFTDHDPGWTVPGLILSGLGLGFLVSSVVSWKLAQKWNATEQPPGSVPTLNT